MVILLVGPTGSGKSTVGAELAQQLGWRFVEADDYHPAENIARMAAGAALTDEQRHRWLEAMQRVVDDLVARQEDAVVVAAALTDAHRKFLRAGAGATLVYLDGDERLIRRRVRNRTGHFAGEAILDDQFARLERPADAAAVVGITASPADIANEIRRKLGLAG